MPCFLYALIVIPVFFVFSLFFSQTAFSYSTQQDASVVIGHQYFVQNSSNAFEPSANTMSQPNGVFFDGNMVLVADSDNNRVLIYFEPPVYDGEEADIVVGQQDFVSNQVNGGAAAAANTLSSPTCAVTDGTALIICDPGNHRVLVYNTIPTENGESADVVIGQSDFVSNTANQGAAASGSSLNSPVDASYDGSTLFIADRDNNRVLIFNTLPAANNTPADYAIGQFDLVSTSANQGGSPDSDSLNLPTGVFSNGSKVFIADRSNHRVLIFSSIPTFSGDMANVVIGQVNFTGNSSNMGGGAGADTLNFPTRVHENGDGIIISDQGNNRVLLYDGVPFSNGGAADLVVGQPDMSSTIANQGGAANSDTIDTPVGVVLIGDAFLIADKGNHRVLVYDTVPAGNGGAADLVMGQDNFENNNSNHGATPDAFTINNAASVFATGTTMLVSDTFNSRVLIYDYIPTENYAAASVVVGQSAFNENFANQGGATNSNTLFEPTYAFYDGTKLYVADTGNNRVLIYNSLPALNNASASVVIGQANMTSYQANQGGSVAANTLSKPTSVFSDGTKLYIADSNNHRVLIYNSIPAVNNASANIVVGQADLVSNGDNQGGGAAGNTLSKPYFAYSDGTQLYVSDRGNNRVLIYSSIPGANNANANYAIGQADLVSNVANQGAAVAANTLASPAGIHVAGAYVYIADNGNHRVLIFKNIPTANNANADIAIGQPNLLSNAVNNGGWTASYNLNAPMGVSATINRMFVADAQNNRGLIYLEAFPDSGQNLGTYNTNFIVAADVEGDGDIDIIEGNDSQANRIWLNNGAGGYSDSGQTLGTNTTITLTAGDIDNDGDIDFLAANGGTQQKWTNNGSGTFSNSAIYAGVNTMYMQLGDVDLDGDLDFAAINSAVNSEIWLNDGTGNFSNSGQSLTSSNGRSGALADFDRDGDPDLYLGEDTAVANRFFKNDGKGTFTNTFLTYGSHKTVSVAAADFNGDTFIDIYEGNGMSVSQDDIFRKYTSISGFSTNGTVTNTDVTECVAAGDFDGDGDFDVAQGVNSNPNTILFNDGNGNFNPSGLSLGGTDDTRGILALDVDNDGDLDIATGNYGVANKIFLNIMDHPTTAPAFPVIIAHANQGYFGATGTVTLQWNNGSDNETTDQDMLTYDLRMGTSSGGCEIYCGFFPASGTTPYLSPGFANTGATTSWTFNNLATGTFYWTVRTVDTTFRRSAWDAEDSFVTTAYAAFTFSGQYLGSYDTSAIYVADIDGDDDLDVVEANYAQANRTYTNNGSGTLTETATALDSLNTTDIVAVDIDGDGDMDLITTNFGQTNKVWNNDGSGGFTDSGQTFAVYDTNGLAAADIDNDGDLDFITANYTGAGDRVFTNDGAGTFSDTTQTLGASNSTSAVTGDIDNDGDIDFAVSVDGNANLLYLNNGNGTFFDSGASMGVNNTQKLAMFDLDADGYPDIVAGDTQQNRIYQNNQAGGYFDTGQFLGVTNAQTDGLFIADFSGDGYPDIAGGNTGVAPANRIWLNNGSGVFSDTSIVPGASSTVSVFGADFDKDGDLDLLVGNDSNKANELWTNGINHSNSNPVSPYNYEPENDYTVLWSTTSVILDWGMGSDDEISDDSLLTYDLRVGTSSGGCEVFCGYFASSANYIGSWYGNAGATRSYELGLSTGTYFWSVRTVDTTFKRSNWTIEDSFTISPTLELVWTSAESDNTSGFSWGDYDNDGDLDLLSGSSSGAYGNRLYRNDGGDNFTLVWTQTPYENTLGVAWGDFNNDGTLDTLFGNSSVTSRIYKYAGGDTFTLYWTSTLTDSVVSVSTGDHDNDGDLDFAFGISCDSRVYTNDGGGSFSNTWTGTFCDTTRSIAFGDYDNDGDLDLFMGNSGMNRIFQNDATGFTSMWTSAATDNTRGAAWGDYDNDGDLDIMTANDGAANRLYETDAGSNFWLMWTSVETENNRTAAWGDFDGDGYIDILFGTDYSNPATIYKNDSGASNFIYTWESPDYANYDIAWGDYDNDGDLDIAFGNYGEQSTVFKNNLDFTNNAPSAPAATSEPDTTATSSTAIVVLEWGLPTDDITPSSSIQYHVRVGTQSMGHEIVSGVFEPPFVNAAATNSILLRLPEGTYYWSVQAIDLAGFATSPWTAEDSFTIFPPMFYDSGVTFDTDQVAAAALADFDSDGDLDLVTARPSAFANEVWMNNGDGTFASGTALSVAADTYAITVGDIDNDGDLDIISGNSPTAVNRTYLNNGAGSFTVDQTFGANSTVAIAAVDLDGDGDLDIAAGNTSGENNFIWENNGYGSFTSQAFLGSSNTRGITYADVDSDGDFDLITANDGVSSNIVWRNDHNFNFTSVDFLGANSSYQVFASDVNGDGAPDICVANNVVTSNAIYLNDGSGSFTNTGQLLDTNDSTSLFMADFDNDGDFDMAVANYSGDPLEIWLNSATGTFTNSGTALGSYNSNFVTGGDLDGDGDIDLVEMTELAETNTFWENNYSGSFTAPTAPTGTPIPDKLITGATTTIPFNWSAASDADTTNASLLTYDVRIGHATNTCDVYCGYFPSTGSVPFTSNGIGNIGASTTFPIVLSTGTYYWNVRTVDATFARSSWSATDSFTITAASASFSPAWNSTETDNSYYGVALCDFNNSGYLDIHFANYAQINRIYRNDTAFGFTAVWNSTAMQASMASDCGDYDGDGDMDVVVANAVALNKVYRNDGAFSFSLPWTSAVGDTTYAIHWGDYDNDGDLDFISANDFASNHLRRNDGGDIFVTVWDSPSAQSRDVLFGDYDNDGDLDILDITNGSTTNKLYRNDGGNSFTNVWNSPISSFCQSAAWADYDGDGDIDFVTAANNEANRLYRNNGDDTFTNTWTSNATARTSSVAWADFDNDGDYDFVVANGTNVVAQANVVYQNNGADSFSINWVSDESENSVSARWGDMDADGDLDFVVSNYGQTNRVYSNIINPVNNAPTVPAGFSAISDFISYYATQSVLFSWSTGADAETSNAALLTYDLRIGTATNSCDVLCGTFSATSSFSGNGFGNVGASTGIYINLATGTYYWNVRTVDSTFERGPWTATDSFTITGISPTLSTIYAAPISGVPANGSCSSIVIVTPYLDTGATAGAGVPVSVYTSGSASATAVTDNADGTYTSFITDTAVETAYVVAAVNDIYFTSNASVSFATEIISVSVGTSTFSFGAQNLDTWQATKTTTITNTGNVNQLISGQISQYTTGVKTWSIGAVNGANQVRAQYATSSFSPPAGIDITAYDAPGNFIIDTLAPGATTTLYFTIQTPTTTGSLGPYTSTATINAAFDSCP